MPSDWMVLPLVKKADDGTTLHTAVRQQDVRRMVEEPADVIRVDLYDDTTLLVTWEGGVKGLLKQMIGQK